MPPAKLRTEQLRARLLDHAISGVEREGLPALRARQIAAAAGTSTAALYELFGDKEGLFRAVFYEAFRMLRERLDAVPITDDPRADLVALLDASRVFAREHPMLFHVMYSGPVAEFDPGEDDRRAAASVYKLIVSRVDRWLGPKNNADLVDAAHALVSLNRGLVASELAGLLGTSEKSRQRRWQLAIDALLNGLVQPLGAVKRKR